MNANIVWIGCLTLCLISSCSGGLLRVPKVYNAIISSSDNLTPSRAFPLIQPVLHETLGYPITPPLIYQDIKPPLFQRSEADEEKSDERKIPEFEIKSPPEESVQEDEKPKEQPLTTKEDQNILKETPLKLNQFGLPPSLVPVNQFPPRITYQYDPYNPYYDPYNGVLLPYNNVYNPYYPYAHNPFNPYLVHAPFYNIPPTFQGNEQTLASQPAWPPQQPTQSEEKKPQEPEKPQNFPPPDLNVKNNGNKNADIPDVPPPPLPVGGVKQDKKTPS